MPSRQLLRERHSHHIVILYSIYISMSVGVIEREREWGRKCVVCITANRFARILRCDFSRYNIYDQIIIVIL